MDRAAEGPPALKRVICVDVDGTLCDSSHRLPAANAAALRTAMSQGVSVVLATGKMRGEWLPPVVEALGFPRDAVALNAPAVTLNGLLVTDQDGSAASEQLMPREVVTQALRLGGGRASAGLTTICFSTEGLLAAELDEWTEHAKQYQEPPTRAIGASAMAALGDLGGGGGGGDSPGVFKVTFWGTEEAISAAQPHIAAALGDGATVVRSLGTLIEVLPPGCGKAEGVKIALGLLGVDVSDVLALGDGENDAEMLRMVRDGGGVSVAMANGMDLTKAAASEVGLSNDEAGVAHAGHRYVLGTQTAAAADDTEAGPPAAAAVGPTSGSSKHNLPARSSSAVGHGRGVAKL